MIYMKRSSSERPGIHLYAPPHDIWVAEVYEDQRQKMNTVTCGRCEAVNNIRIGKHTPYALCCDCRAVIWTRVPDG